MKQNLNTKVLNKSKTPWRLWVVFFIDEAFCQNNRTSDTNGNELFLNYRSSIWENGSLCGGAWMPRASQ